MNYYCVPRFIIDDWLPLLNGSELRVVMAVASQTLCLGRTMAALRRRELMALTGLAERTQIETVNALARVGLWTVAFAATDDLLYYSINIHDCDNITRALRDRKEYNRAQKETVPLHSRRRQS